MKEEQQKEELQLMEKEKEFYVVDRLGMIALIQKYC